MCGDLQALVAVQVTTCRGGVYCGSPITGRIACYFARQHAIACSVRYCYDKSHSGIVSKRMHMSSNSFHHQHNPSILRSTAVTKLQGAQRRR